MSGQWVPLGARPQNGRPEVGDVIARGRVVWRVLKVATTDLTDQEREAWVAGGMPDLAGQSWAPYHVEVEAFSEPPADWPAGQSLGRMRVPYWEWFTWYVYPRGRWARCSCCGEPMPCRAANVDDVVEQATEQVERFVAVGAGCCWGCGDPVTTRQSRVDYPGENLDLPGAPAPLFHTRRRCWHHATAYERRWIAVDPRRERILTWPNCPRTLVVHADGSSECTGMEDSLSLLGPPGPAAPDCDGHLTHDHRSYTACYVRGGCPRGCARQGHAGIRTTPRPDRRTATLGGGRG